MSTLTMLEEQYRLFEELKLNFETFKRDFANREVKKSRKFYYQKKLDLTQLYIKITRNNRKIIAAVSADHEYVADEYYEKSDAIYEEYLNFLEAPEVNPALYEDETDSKLDEDEKLKIKEENLKILGGNLEKLEKKSEEKNLNKNNEESKTSASNEFTEQLADLLYDLKQDRDYEVGEFWDDPKEWLKWRNMFELSVGKKRRPDLEKFSILVKKIKGKKGKAVLDGIVFDPSNYKVAWEAICKAFHNESQLVRIELAEFFKAPKIENNTNNRGINMRTMFNKTNRLFTNMKSIFNEKGNLTEEKIHVKICNAMVIYQLENNLDEVMRLQWGVSRKGIRTVPLYTELLNFLDIRSDNIEYFSEQKPSIGYKPHTQKYPFKMTSFVANEKRNCFLCKTYAHELFNCPKFKELNVFKRSDFVFKNNICKLCLKHEYNRKLPCKSKFKCFKCTALHHTLLHKENLDMKKNTQTKRSFKTPIVNTHVANFTNNNVYAPTALVNVKDKHGNLHQVRILLDSGSDGNLISSFLCKKLQLKMHKEIILITGISNAQKQSNGFVNLEISSKINDFCLAVEAVVIKNIPKYVNKSKYLHKNSDPANLADNGQHDNNGIDIILGVSEFPKIFKSQSPTSKNNILSWSTEFGDILMGSAYKNEALKNITNFSIKVDVMQGLEENIKKFWELEVEEDIDENEYCKEYFNKTLKTVGNQYQVSVPYKPGAEIGESFEMAYSRLRQTLKKLEKDKLQYKLYNEAFNELMENNYIEEVKIEEVKNFLPHSGVYRPEHKSTPLRIVYDGSAKTSNGFSLNQVMYNGPKLQSEIFVIINRFRMHEFCIMADIQKMFLKVLVDEPCSKFQAVLWKRPGETLKAYKHRVLVFGLGSSPWLACRCVAQIGEDEQKNFPLVKKLINENFYVDDAIISTKTIDQGKEIVRQLTCAFNNHGFKLRKWSANNDKILEKVPKEDKLHKESLKEFDFSDFKMLGLHYDPNMDTLKMKIRKRFKPANSKSEILSQIMAFYDPIGYVEPIRFKGKCIIQSVWKESLGWNEALPAEIVKEWTAFADELNDAKEINLPRNINFDEKNSQIILFSDASLFGYSTCAYIRNNINGKIYVKFVAAKSRVAPVKNKLTIPRLELLSIVLATELLEKLKNAWNICSNENVIVFNDSQVAISWLQRDENELKMFVANRVKLIKTRLNVEKIFYVTSEDNIADLATRKCKYSDFIASRWFSGPEFLLTKELNLKEIKFNSDLEVKRTKLFAGCLSFNRENVIIKLVEKISSLTKLLRIVACCLRFKNKLSGAITAEEMIQAEKIVIFNVQNHYFLEEINQLKKGKHVKNGNLVGLNPYYINNELRVGGRITRSALKLNAKNSLILPKLEMKSIKDYDAKGNLVKMLILHAHQQTAHGGLQAVLMNLRQKFWILNAKRAIQFVLKRCILCTRYNAKACVQQMGILPEARVTRSYIFQFVNVDMAGPVLMKSSFLRSNQDIKAYLLIFICNSTKAIHIEVITRANAQAYIAALKRFIARRNFPSQITHDNGGNFVSGARQIEENRLELLRQLEENGSFPEIIEYCASLKIKIIFTPSYSPTVNGLCERAVGSVKVALRAFGHQSVTYEQLATWACEAEMAVNARPLTLILSADSSQEVLSPAHFLTNRGFDCMPAPFMTNETITNNWQFIQAQQEKFWELFTNDYLFELQKMSKWVKKEDNLKINQIVLVKQENLPRLYWNYAKIAKVHYDSNNLVHIVEIQIGNRTEKLHKRHLSKLILLPVETDEVSQENTEKGETYVNNKNDSLKVQQNLPISSLTEANGNGHEMSIPILEMENLKISSSACEKSKGKSKNKVEVPIASTSDENPSKKKVKVNKKQVNKKKTETIFEPGPRRSIRIKNQKKRVMSNHLTFISVLSCMLMLFSDVQSQSVDIKEYSSDLNVIKEKNKFLIDAGKIGNESSLLLHIDLPTEGKFVEFQISPPSRELPEGHITQGKFSTSKFKLLQRHDMGKSAHHSGVMHLSVLLPNLEKPFKFILETDKLVNKSKSIIELSHVRAREINRKQGEKVENLQMAFFQPIATLLANAARNFAKDSYKMIITRGGSSRGAFAPVSAARKAIDDLQSIKSVAKENAYPIKNDEPTTKQIRDSKPEINLYPVSKIKEGGFFMGKVRTLFIFNGEIQLDIKTNCELTADLEKIQYFETLMGDSCYQTNKHGGVGEEYCRTLQSKILNEKRHLVDYIKGFFDTKTINQKRFRRETKLDDEVNVRKNSLFNDLEEKEENFFSKWWSKMFKRDSDSPGVITSIWRFLFGGGVNIKQIENKIALVNHNLESFRVSQNQVEDAERVLYSIQTKLGLQMDAMGSAFNSYNVDIVNFYLGFVYHSCLNALTSIRNKYDNVMTPIYTLTEMEQMRERVKTMLPTGGFLPDVDFTKLITMNKKSLLKAVNGVLHISYFLPLIQDDVFEEFDIEATPDYETNLIYEVPEENIAYSESTQKYFYITDDLEQIMLSDDEIIIKPIILSSASTSTDCFIAALLSKPDYESCNKVKIDENFDEIMQISKHRYLFYTYNENSASIICQNQRTPITERNGLVTLQPGCKLITRTKEIHEPIDSTISYEEPDIYYVPPVKIPQRNVTEIAKEIIFPVTVKIPETLTMKTEEDFISAPSSSEKNSKTLQNWLIIALLVIAKITLIILIICVIYYCIKKTRRISTPIANNLRETFNNLNFDSLRRQMGEGLNSFRRAGRTNHRPRSGDIPLVNRTIEVSAPIGIPTLNREVNEQRSSIVRMQDAATNHYDFPSYPYNDFTPEKPFAKPPIPPKVLTAPTTTPILEHKAV
jgi:hypothetical protein